MASNDVKAIRLPFTAESPAINSVWSQAVLELSGSDRTLVRMLCKQLLGPPSRNVKVVGFFGRDGSEKTTCYIDF